MDMRLGKHRRDGESIRERFQRGLTQSRAKDNGIVARMDRPNGHILYATARKHHPIVFEDGKEFHTHLVPFMVST